MASPEISQPIKGLFFIKSYVFAAANLRSIHIFGSGFQRWKQFWFQFNQRVISFAEIKNVLTWNLSRLKKHRNLERHFANLFPFVNIYIPCWMKSSRDFAQTSRSCDIITKKIFFIVKNKIFHFHSLFKVFGKFSLSRLQE